jgi:hypothetical protein
MHADEATPAAPAARSREAISASIAKWNAHQRGCGVCTNAGSAAALCLAGALLWGRVASTAHPQMLPTSALLLIAAEAFEAAMTPKDRVDSDLNAYVATIRARAAYMQTMGDHDYGGATCTACGEVMP